MADRDSSAPPCGHRLGWAALLARVFAADLSGCRACGGRLRIVAALTDPAVAAAEDGWRKGAAACGRGYGR